MRRTPITGATPISGRRPGSDAAAVGVHRQLDAVGWRGAARRRLPSRRSSHGGRRRAQVFRSSPAGGAQACNCSTSCRSPRRRDRSAVGGVFRARRDGTRRWSTPRSAACGCASSCPVRTSTRRSCDMPRAPAGAAARGGRRDLRVPADHVPLQSDGRRRAVGLGRLHELRQRSFSINDEANLNVFDAASRAAQIEVFEADKQQSKEVTLAQWRSRPWTERMVDMAASLAQVAALARATAAERPPRRRARTVSFPEQESA